MATADSSNRLIHIWELDPDVLLVKASTKPVPQYTSAKIVLVGESNVGKSCLAMRLAEETQDDRRRLFTRFVEDHLRQNGVEISEHQAIKCRKYAREIAEDIVSFNIAEGRTQVVCPWCQTTTRISDAVAKIRERNPESDQRIYALRKKIDEKTAKDAEHAKKAIARGTDILPDPDTPIRILHLSDLHFGTDTSPDVKVQWLVQDICKGECLEFETVEYIVISGDMTDRGNEKGWENARKFVSLLNEKLGVSAERCIFVPGNHDVQDRKASYEWTDSLSGLSEDHPDGGKGQVPYYDIGLT